MTTYNRSVNLEFTLPVNVTDSGSRTVLGLTVASSSVSLSPNLTAVTATGAVGSIVGGSAYSLTSVFSTGTVGNLIVSNSITLTSVNATGTSGLFLNSNSTNNLTAVTATGVARNFSGFQDNINLVDVYATGAIGQFEHRTYLASVSCTGIADIIRPSFDVFLDITGSSGTGVAGTISVNPVRSVNLTSVFATGYAQQFGITLEVSASGPPGKGGGKGKGGGHGNVSKANLNIEIIDVPVTGYAGNIGHSIVSSSATTVTLTDTFGQGYVNDFSFTIDSNGTLPAVSGTGTTNSLVPKLLIPFTQVPLIGTSASFGLQTSSNINLPSVYATGVADILNTTTTGTGTTVTLRTCFGTGEIGTFIPSVMREANIPPDVIGIVNKLTTLFPVGVRLIGVVGQTVLGMLNFLKFDGPTGYGRNLVQRRREGRRSVDIQTLSTNGNSIFRFY